MLQLLEMDTVMMKQIKKPATLMAGIVVDLVSIQNTAQIVYVLEKLLEIRSLIHWLEMDIAKMKPTMKTATLMEVTVV